MRPLSIEWGQTSSCQWFGRFIPFCRSSKWSATRTGSDTKDVGTRNDLELPVPELRNWAPHWCLRHRSDTGGMSQFGLGGRPSPDPRSAGCSSPAGSIASRWTPSRGSVSYVRPGETGSS